METINKRAFSEVIQILNHTDKEITEKIPQKFIDFLFKNTDDDYMTNINFNDDNWSNTITDDTKAILAMIYRDYIVSEDEKLELIKEEKAEQAKQEELLREKYNPDNLFKSKSKIEEDKQEQENAVTSTQLIEIKEAPWYKRLFKKILSIFGLQNK